MAGRCSIGTWTTRSATLEAGSNAAAVGTERVPRLTHPLTGGVYELESEGRVRVEEDERVGWFDARGAWQRGELRHADAQLIGWLAGAWPRNSK